MDGKKTHGIQRPKVLLKRRGEAELCITCDKTSIKKNIRSTKKNEICGKKIGLIRTSFVSIKFQSRQACQVKHFKFKLASEQN